MDEILPKDKQIRQRFFNSGGNHF